MKPQFGIVRRFRGKLQKSAFKGDFAMKKQRDKEARLSGNENRRADRQPEAARDPRPGYGNKKLDGPNIPST